MLINGFSVPVLAVNTRFTAFYCIYFKILTFYFGILRNFALKLFCSEMLRIFCICFLSKIWKDLNMEE